MEAKLPKAKRGRPLKGKDASGKPIPVRDYVSVNARLPVELEKKLRALAYLSGMSSGELFRKIVEQYINTLQPDLQRKVSDTAKVAGSEDIFYLSK